MLQHAAKRYKYHIVFTNRNKESELVYEQVPLNFAFVTICMICLTVCCIISREFCSSSRRRNWVGGLNSDLKFFLNLKTSYRDLKTIKTQYEPPGINTMIKYVHWNKEFLHNFAYKTWEFNTHQQIEYSIATLEYRLKRYFVNHLQLKMWTWYTWIVYFLSAVHRRLQGVNTTVQTQFLIVAWEFRQGCKVYSSRHKTSQKCLQGY